jgi:hypothetical protein
MVGLFGLNGEEGSTARAVSADGVYVAGTVRHPGAQNGRAARWENGVPALLPGIPNMSTSIATGMSDDGGVVTGIAFLQGGTATPFVWTPTTGTVALRNYLLTHNVPLPSDFGFANIVVSGDGRSFAGIGGSATIDGQGFIA